MATRVPQAEVEVARARLLELVPGGFEEIDGEGWVELAAYTDDAGAARIRAAFAAATVRCVEAGWEDRWREFHRSVRAGGLWIGPPWEEPPTGEAVVVVDPGRAFGTGAHATTRACIELLSTLERGSMLDAGCGSGVVAVAATRLGFGPLVAVDLDAIAVDVARDTARRNGVEVDVRRVDVLSDDLPSSDVVVANIELKVVEGLLERDPARTAVTSGYLAAETPRAPNWTVVTRLELDGWAADVLTAE